tara:strand:+ start:1460 stop:1969 length:510 start_codon:yes stop_codon:yes gene_type:complete
MHQCANDIQFVMDSLKSRFFSIFLVLFLSFSLLVPSVEALNLELSQLNLVKCDTADPASKQPKGYRSGCYILDGEIKSTAKSLIKDVDVFAFIYDASGEEVLPNRPRIGSINNVPIGTSQFSVRVPIPSFAVPPFTIKKAKAKIAIPVPTISKDSSEEDILPLERSIEG